MTPTAWAIRRAELDTIVRADVPDLMADADVEAADAMYAARGRGREGNVAIVPVLGPISKRDTVMTMMFGGTSTNRLVAQFRQLAADESVSTVVLNIDSPGGTISGLPELAAEIRTLRETKRVVAISNDLAASAAYWVASQADEIIATPESLTGSVGVYLMHTDLSAAAEQDGVKVTFIASDDAKVAGNSFEPLTDEARAEFQGIVDDAYGLFVADVAKGRGVTAATVRRDFGSGRVFTATEAKAAGLVDRIATYTDAVARIASGRRAEGIVELVAELLRVDDDEDIEPEEVATDNEAARLARLEVEHDAFIFGG